MRRWLSILADLPGLVAAGALGLLLGRTVAGRYAYPFDLEWMEGGMLLHAWRVLEGLPIYAEPTADWVPYIYPPLYPWLVALLGALGGGVDYPAARLLSVVGVAAACAAMVVALRREGGGPLAGLGAVALFLSTYDDSGSFMDLVRTDGLLVGLLAWSLVSVRGGRVVLGGLLLVLAFMAKHNAAAFGLPCILWLWWARGRRDALRFGAASVLPALAFTGTMQLASGGTFLRYLLEVPSHHGFVLKRFFPGTPVELWEALPVALPLALVGAAAWGLRRWRGSGTPSTEGRQAAVFWGANIALAVLFGMIMRGHQGGYLNVLMPAHWAVALGAGLGAVMLRRAWTHPAVVLATSLVLAVGAWQGRWEVAAELPTDADREAGERLLETIAAVDGPVFIPHAPWYPVKVGKEGSPPLIAIWDIDHEGGPFHGGVEELERAMADHRWGAVITAKRKLGYGLREHYSLSETLRYPGRAFYPKTGWQVRPRYVYVPREAAADGTGESG